ncbi:hypothetical protein HNQ85_002218 [Anoxybacillus calidus]|uniref:Uncharacterized protein n=1 Tax=[Anoxybacillus] calidus TaxID=575178 RepID=A0A7W0BVJ1_9BACL|nr:hypothetical protein [Anoxybacillus calidus]
MKTIRKRYRNIEKGEQTEHLVKEAAELLVKSR